MPRLASYNLDIITSTPATIFNTSNLGTTPVKFPDTSTGSPGLCNRHFIVTNMATAAYVTLAMSGTGNSPTFTASGVGTATATMGIPVPPLSRYEFNMSSNVSLWFAASAGSTPMQIAAFDKAV